MTIPVANSSDSGWIAELSGDPAVQSDVTTLAADGTLSYGDLLQTLTDLLDTNEASNARVSAAQFDDLKIIAANLDFGVTTSDSAASAFMQLVDGSSLDGSKENAYWTGGAQTNWTGGSTKSPTKLGDLKVGTTTAQLAELIDKWFDGTDLPDPTVYELSKAAVSYENSSLDLYGSSGAPAVGDIAQGADGDCELCAGMIELLDNHLASLESMIVSDGNGVYSIRFYVSGNEIWETVNTELPVDSNGDLVYMNEFSASNAPIWADLVEKAYAQLSSTGLIGHPAQNSYDNIAADFADDVLPDLTDATSVNYYYSTDANWNADKEVFIQALAAGDDVILESYGATYDASGNEKLIDDHAFAITGYDATTGDFDVRNPWGVQAGPQQYDTTFEVSMDDISHVDGDVVIDNAAAPSTIEILTAPEGWSSSGSTSYAYPESLVAGASVPVASLFKVIDTTGSAITEYMFQAIGSGAVDLNGATNLATAAEQAQGEYVVSASDLSKVTYVAGSDVAQNLYGSQHLLVWAYDGTTWSPSTDISLTLTNEPVAVAAAIDAVTAPSETILASSLFTVIGPATSYEIEPEKGGGSLSDTSFTNAELSTVTYTAPSTPGIVTLDAWAFDGNQGSEEQNIQVLVGTTVADAVQDYDDGQLSGAVAVADTAANIFANLDGLQAMLAAGVLQAITITDTTDPMETVTPAQDADDKGLLAILQGNYRLDVTNPTLFVSSSSHTQSATDLGIGGTVTITLNMSEGSLTVSGTPGLTLNDGGTASYVAASSNLTAGMLTFEYTVASGQNTPDLQVTGTTNGPWSVQDSSGNSADFSGAMRDLGLVVDTEVGNGTPAVTGATVSAGGGPAANTGYAIAGDTIEIDIAFSNAPLVVTGGTPVLKLGSFATTYISTATDLMNGILAFDYTVASGQKLTMLKISSLTLPKGVTVTNDSDQAANLKLTAAEKDLAITADGTPPTVKSVKASPAKNIVDGDTLTFTLKMSENVMVTGTPSLALSDQATASYAKGSGSNTLTFTYDVGAESTTDLEILGINQSAGNAITDLAGNALSSTLTKDLKLTVNAPPTSPHSADVAKLLNAIASFTIAPAASDETPLAAQPHRENEPPPLSLPHM